MDLKADAVMMSVKMTAASALSVPVAGYVVPMWGTSLSSFGLAALGAIMSYAWDKPERDRRVLIFKTLSITLFSVALVVVLPGLAGWTLEPRAEPPLAFILALFGRHIIMGIRHAAPAIGRGIVGIFTKRDNYSGYDYGNDDARDNQPPRNDKNEGGY